MSEPELQLDLVFYPLLAGARHPDLGLPAHLYDQLSYR